MNIKQKVPIAKRNPYTIYYERNSRLNKTGYMIVSSVSLVYLFTYGNRTIQYHRTSNNAELIIGV